MSVTNLDALFRPTSIAVIGATRKPKDLGSIMMRNLLSGRFLGPVMPVSEQLESVAGVLAYKDIENLPLTPDLAVLCCPPGEVPKALRTLGKRGTRAAVVPGPFFAQLDPEAREQVEAEVRKELAASGIRLLGPNCMGLVAPGTGLNASLAHTDALPGRIAFVTQSDSLFTTVLDWARTNDIGFSHYISLGDQMDVNFASVLDYLGADPMTRSILLYVESICDARRFMSAARASARNKPILVIKPGRSLTEFQPDNACVIEHENADAIYDVAFRRAGIVRVDAIDSLFDGAQTLARSQPLWGDGLVILTNGRSVGMLAGDACLAGGGELARMREATREKLAGLLGSDRKARNPVVVPFNATGKQYVEVLEVLLKDPTVASILVMHVPFAEVDGVEVARAVSGAVAKTKRVVLTNWLGSEVDQEARRVFADAGIPGFDTPDKAVRAYLHMVTYRRSQELLMETPDSLPTDFFPDTEKAREVVAAALEEGRSKLGEAEAKSVLTAYGVPVVETRGVKSAREAVIAADELGYPVALKVRSPQIRQPFDVGGVALDLETPEQVWDTAASMVARVNRLAPDAYIEGFLVQQMGRRPGARELYIGAHVDPVFGPVISFGHGGMAMSVIQDTAVSLPPLNMSLARELIGRTRISKLLTGPGPHEAADLDDICLTLIQVTQLVIDVPQVTRVEINPLFADDKGVLALGAQVHIDRARVSGPDRLAIRPYPRELEECVALKTGEKVLLRPIRPEDAPAHFDFVKSLSVEDLRLRFFGKPRQFEFSDMAGFTQIDYDREMAFIATRELNTGDTETLGVVRASTTPDNARAEFAIILHGEMKGTGLGKALMDKMIRYSRARGTRVLMGETLPENKAMMGLAKHLGFEVRVDYEDDLVIMKLPLREENGT